MTCIVENEGKYPYLNKCEDNNAICYTIVAGARDGGVAMNCFKK